MAVDEAILDVNDHVRSTKPNGSGRTDLLIIDLQLLSQKNACLIRPAPVTVVICVLSYEKLC